MPKRGKSTPTSTEFELLSHPILFMYVFHPVLNCCSCLCIWRTRICLVLIWWFGATTSIMGTTLKGSVCQQMAWVFWIFTLPYTFHKLKLANLHVRKLNRGYKEREQISWAPSLKSQANIVHISGIRICNARFH